MFLALSSVPRADGGQLKDLTDPKWKAPLSECVCKAGLIGCGSDDDLVSRDMVFSSFFQAKAQQGWLVVGTVGCPGPEISHSTKVPITSCLEFIWDRPTLLVLGR